ncbi:MAG: oligosaccharide flippase family protein [Saprospiraceae bacterium]|nr:oligosaccharide flippase family protein [Saprospiraceae bacterium]
MLVFARLAGPAAAGDFALAAGVMGFLSLFAEAGLGQALVQGPLLRQEGRAVLASLGVVLGLIFWLLLYWSSTGISAWYGRPELAGVLPLMGLSLWVAPVGAQQMALLTRDFQFQKVALIETVSAGAGFAVLVVLLSLNWGIWAMAYSFLLRQLVSAGLGLLWGQRCSFSPGNRAIWRELWPLLRFGGYDLASRWADFMANYLDKLILGKWLGAEALGYYQLAFTLCVLPTARLGHVLVRVGYPVFAKVQHDALALNEWFQRTAQQLVVLLFPLYLGIGLFAREIITVAFGPAWLPATPLLQAFAVAGLVRTLNGVFPYLCKGIGKPELLLRWMVYWTLAINVFLTLFLTLSPTANAAAWSRVAAKILVEIPLLFWLAAQCRVDFRPILILAGRVLIWMAPFLASVCLLKVFLEDCRAVTVLSGLIFSGGIAWLGWQGKWQEGWSGKGGGPGNPFPYLFVGQCALVIQDLFCIK